MGREGKVAGTLAGWGGGGVYCGHYPGGAQVSRKAQTDKLKTRRQTDSPTDGRMDGQTDRQTDRQTGRQADRVVCRYCIPGGQTAQQPNKLT